MELQGYDQITLVGEGGLGRVYRARRVSTGGVVAIKELRDVTEGSPAWHRARRELEALLRLKGHPYVVNVEEVVQGAEGPCLVMEYAVGGSLMQRLANGPLSGPELVVVGQHVCEALGAAHALGIIHRDIKPHNLLVGAFGQVKVCDFGIATLVRDGDARTKTGALTMAYASPEELDDDDDIGPAADVYSFGATMMHLATGKRPSFRDRVEGNTVGFGQQDPALAAAVRLLRRTLAHDPADRPTIAELSEAFDASATQLGTRRLRALDLAPTGSTATVQRVSDPKLALPQMPLSPPPPEPAADLETTVVRQPAPAPPARTSPPAASPDDVTVARAATPPTESPADPARRRWPWVACAAAAALLVIAVAMRSGDDAPSADGSPQPTDAWTIAYGIRICDTELRSLAGTSAELGADASTGDMAKVQGGADRDGLVHYHAAIGGNTGEKATLGVFLDVYGVRLTDRRLEMPSSQVDPGDTQIWDLNNDPFKDTACEGQQPVLKVRVWLDPLSRGGFKDYTSGFRDIRFTNNGMAFVIAIVPDAADVPKPASTAKLAEMGLGAVSSPSVDTGAFAQPVETTAVLLPPGPAEKPGGLIAGVLYDSLIAAGVEPGVARCAADDLVMNTSEADLLALGIASSPMPPEVVVLLNTAGLRCGVTPDQLARANQ